MSTRWWDEEICAACGEKSEHLVIGSAMIRGSGDMDGRPPEMLRETMPFWIHDCPSCGYAASDISEREDGVAEAMATSGWRELAESSRRFGLVNRFRRRAYLDEAIGRPTEAASWLLCACWALDDERDFHGARRMREETIAMQLLGIERMPADDPAAIDMRFVLADLLRRCKGWEAAAAVCRELSGFGLDRSQTLNLEFLRRVIAVEYDLAVSWDNIRRPYELGIEPIAGVTIDPEEE